MDFRGKVALITGGACGIGFAVAKQLYELGAKVVIADLNEKRAQDSVKSMKSTKSFAIKVDVQSPTDANRMVEKVIDKWGKIDILVHSAGVGIERSFLETTPEEWKQLIDIDLSGTF